MQAHHVGYLVADMNNALKEFLNLGYEIEQEIMHDSLRNINICFMRNNGFLIELISPCEGCKSFAGLSRRIGNAPYHICYITSINEGGGVTFSEQVALLEKHGYTLIKMPEAAPALGGRKVAFMMNDAIGLIEILEGEK